MGYEATLKVGKEIDSKYKSWSKSTTRRDLNKYRDLLVAVCLMDREIASSTLKSIHAEIEMFVKMYINMISEVWKISLEKELEEEDGEFYVCGWEYSSTGGVHDWTIDELEDYITENLFLLAIHKTGSPFSRDEKEREEYHEKAHQIKDELADVEDIVNGIWNHMFLDEYKKDDNSNYEESY